MLVIAYIPFAWFLIDHIISVRSVFSLFPALRVLFLSISTDFHASIAFACFSIHHITTLNI